MEYLNKCKNFRVYKQSNSILLEAKNHNTYIFEIENCGLVLKISDKVHKKQSSNCKIKDICLLADNFDLFKKNGTYYLYCEQLIAGITDVFKLNPDDSFSHVNRKTSHERAKIALRCLIDGNEIPEPIMHSYVRVDVFIEMLDGEYMLRKL